MTSRAQGRQELLAATTKQLEHVRAMVECGKLRGAGRIGAPVHDALIAAICEQRNVQQLWSADRDFSRFRAPEIVELLVS